MAEPGLRERKKQQTRLHIAATARQLFMERGFEAVTVTEIARAADVAPATVFNYFATKEELFYSGFEAFMDTLLPKVRDRAPGTSVLAAFAGVLLDGPFAMRVPGGDEEATATLASVTRVIVQSPALLAREREMFDRYARELAALIAEETGAPPDDVACHVAGHALLGLHRSLVDYGRARSLAGDSATAIRRGFRREARKAIERLERGLGDLGA